MITLFSALLGLLGSALPEFLKLWQDRADRAHELQVLDKQLDMQKLGISERLEEIRTASDLAVAQAAYQTYYSGVEWVDALNGTVRPVLAYAFFFLYAVIKLLQFSALVEMQASPFLYLWNEEDQAIFAAIISFYFGQRALTKFRSAK